MHDVLDFATLQDAKSIGLGGVTGSLTPGKQADLLIVHAEDLNNMPLNDPIGTLVLGSDPRNIRAVFIAGQAPSWTPTCPPCATMSAPHATESSKPRTTLEASVHSSQKGADPVVRTLLVLFAISSTLAASADHSRGTGRKPEPSPAASPHPYVGMWVTADGRIRQELLPNGRYEEERDGRQRAYTGRYTVTGNHIDYLDDLGFTATGDVRDGILYHEHLVLHRER